MTRCIAVTGATGMVGRRVVEHFAQLGWSVRALVRDPDAANLPGAASLRRLVMPDALDADALQGVEVLVHAAATTRSTEAAGADATDVRGARSLLAAAREAGVARTVFLSSTSSREDAPGSYGRHKFAIEQLLGDADVALRLGLVVAEGEEGLFGRLVRAVTTRRFLPLIGGGTQCVQPIHVDDVCRAIENALAYDVRGVRTVAAPTGLPFKDLLERLAARTPNRVTFVPCPAAPLLAALRVIEALRLPFPITSDNVRGLVGQRFAPSSDDLAALRIEPMSLDAALDRSGYGVTRAARRPS